MDTAIAAELQSRPHGFMLPADAGRILHAARSEHAQDEGCSRCAADGLAALKRLAEIGLAFTTVRRGRIVWCASASLVELRLPDPDSIPADAEPPPPPPRRGAIAWGPVRTAQREYALRARPHTRAREDS